MMSVLIALIIGTVVATVAVVVRRRQVVDAPTQKVFAAPTQIDRVDFPAAQQEWLVAVFTSASCHVCADMLAKAQVVASKQVAVLDVEYSENKELHRKYNIEAVPTVVVSDAHGVVHKSFLGPVSATDLWAGVASARDPQLQTPADGHCQDHE
jgi:thioredoxin-related protein